MKELFLNLFFICVVTNICNSQNISEPAICPKEKLYCKRCIETCPENETLVTSPCGCCYNQCVPKPKCAADICSRIRCKLPTCENGTTLVEGAGHCGCCPGCVTPKVGDKCYTEVNTGRKTCGNVLICCSGKCREPTSDVVCLNEELSTPDPNCPADICSTVKCRLPTCENGTTLVEGAGHCGCCPGCVTPNVGDKCYTDVNTGRETCGDELICCNGTCRQPKSDRVCLDENLCPYPPKECLLCLQTCPENETLELSPCGCCENRCIPESECPPDFCHRVRCAIPTCKNESILVQGAAMCGCCPGCVTPKIGDKCYKGFNTGLQTCGNKLICCNGRCQRNSFNFFGCLNNPCRGVRCPLIPATCPDGEILARPNGQCCPRCVKPSPGDQCYIDPSTRNSTCGPDLKCCPNGICTMRTALCINYPT